MFRKNNGLLWAKNNPLAKKLRDLSDRVGDDCSK